jgi:hypothetical protein
MTATAELLELLVDELGTPIIAPPLPGLPGLRHFPCPVCGGGMDDRSLLPYRPLTVCDDGRVWCAGMFDRSYAPASCSFTPARLAKALDRLLRVSA